MAEDNGSSTPTSIINELPRSLFWDTTEICNWEGFWFELGLAKSVITFQSTFQAQDDDVLLASTMKTGTTWLKALTLCILKNPINNEEDEDVLIQDNPHFHVQTIEVNMKYSAKPTPELFTISSSPRLFHTHLPFSLLPNSIKTSNCKIVYIARNPKDTFISFWHFFNAIYRSNQTPFPLERALDCFCCGDQLYGPFFEHVLQYWVESKKSPQKILFMKYEDMKRDPHGELRKLGLFLGKPFPLESEEEIEKVLWRCSLERLKGLEVNTNGSGFMSNASGCVSTVPYSAYFRRGVVGDWRNYLTPAIAGRINEVARLKFEGSGLAFDV